MASTSATPVVMNLRESSPPLRIHHLLAWMTATGVLISVTLWLERTLRNGPPIENPVVIVSLMVGAVAVAGVLTIVAFGFSWRRRGYSFPASPGDWLLVALAASFIWPVAALVGLLLIFFIFGDDDWMSVYWGIVFMCILIAWARLNARGMSRYADTDEWRSFYVIMIVLPGTFAFKLIVEEFPTWLPLAAVIACVLWAAWRDVRAEIKRPWTHWVGVGAAVWLCTALIGTFAG